MAFGSCLEFSVDGRVILLVADQSFAKRAVGIYLETAYRNVDNVVLDRMRSRNQTSAILSAGEWFHEDGEYEITS